MNRDQLDIALTARDAELLATLTLRVRCLSFGQVAEHWWGTGRAAVTAARRRLALLADAGYLLSGEVLARPIVSVQQPLVVWKLDDPMPDFGPIAQILKSRLQGPPSSIRVFAATARAVRQVGGNPGRLPRRSETTHDLSLAAVYLLLCRTAPNRARHWVSEAELAARGEGRGQKLADALLVEPGCPPTVVEFGGQYPKQKLAAFHADCAERGRNYEIW